MKILEKVENFIKKANDEKVFTGGEMKEYQFNIDYSNFSYSEALKKLIPEEMEEIPSGFETIGKIAHMNLREKFLPYKFLIGQIVLDVKFTFYT